VKTKTYFAFRVDVWDGAGDNIVEHVAGVDDFETAVATYWAAVRRWPKAKITLRQGAPDRAQELARIKRLPDAILRDKGFSTLYGETIAAMPPNVETSPKWVTRTKVEIADAT
jgi:hypothetical protein